MTYRNNASYIKFKPFKGKGNLGSAGRFIGFAQKQEREKRELRDSPAVTVSQNVFRALE